MTFNQPSFLSKMVHHNFGCYIFVGFSITHFQTGDLEMMDQFLGRHIHHMSLHWMSFYGAGLCNDIVYRTKIRNITDLKKTITNGIATIIDLKKTITDGIATIIDESTLQWAWQELEYRLDVLRITNGVYGEVHH